MKALVTGATGFLGTHLTRHLTGKGWQCTALGSGDADLRDPRSLDRFSDADFDRVFHLAAWTQAGDFCLKHPGEQWINNQQINTTVLGWWASSQPRAKLISIGTSCAYEEGSELREDLYLTGTPIADLYTYAMTKRMLLVGQTSLQRQYGLKWLTVVPSTLYGKEYPLDNEKQMHFIFDLCWKILDHKHAGKAVELWGDGRQRRELVHVDDFITTMLALDQELKIENDVVNIGAGEDHTIAEFATLLCQITGIDPAVIQFDSARYVGAREKMLSNAKLDRLLPNRKVRSLREGLEELVRWLEEQYLNRKQAQTPE